MNAKAELAGTEITAAEHQQLITVDPEQYVDAVYSPFDAQIKAAIAEEPEAQDVTTTAGLAVVTKRRAVFRDLRVAIENERKARKAPILVIGKLLDSRSDELKGLCIPHEEKHDAAIKAEEARKAAIKAEAARVEAERVATIAKLVNEIASAPMHCAGLSVAKHDETIARIEALEITLPVYQERTGEAQQLKDQILAQLGEMKARAVAIEVEQARLKAEAEALSKREAEQAEIERKAAVERQLLADEQAARLRAEQQQRDREAAAERARIEADRKAEQSRIEAARKAEQDRIDAQRREQQAEFDRQKAAQAAEMAKQQAELRRQQEVVAEQQRQIEAARQAEEDRKAKEAQELADKIAADAAAAAAIAKTLSPRPTLAELAADVASARGISVEEASDMIVEAVHDSELAFADQEFDAGN